MASSNPWRRAIGWVYTKRGTLVLSLAALLLGVLEVYVFWHEGGAGFLMVGIIVLAFVIRDWVQLYRHRADPDWPRRPTWVSGG